MCVCVSLDLCLCLFGCLSFLFLSEHTHTHTHTQHTHTTHTQHTHTHTQHTPHTHTHIPLARSNRLAMRVLKEGDGSCVSGVAPFFLLALKSPPRLWFFSLSIISEAQSQKNQTNTKRKSGLCAVCVSKRKCTKLTILTPSTCTFQMTPCVGPLFPPPIACARTKRSKGLVVLPHTRTHASTYTHTHASTYTQAHTYSQKHIHAQGEGEQTKARKLDLAFEHVKPLVVIKQAAEQRPRICRESSVDEITVIHRAHGHKRIHARDKRVAGTRRQHQRAQ